MNPTTDPWLSSATASNAADDTHQPDLHQPQVTTVPDVGSSTARDEVVASGQTDDAPRRDLEIDGILRPMPAQANGRVSGDSKSTEKIEPPDQAQSRSADPVPRTASTSVELGTGIAKGTGPEIGPEPHHPSPHANYNPKELAHDTRAPPRDPSDDSAKMPDSTVFQDRVHATTDEQPPAKRPRLDGYSTSPLTSPDSMDHNEAHETQFGTDDPTTIPSYFNAELLKYIWPVVLEAGIANPIQLLSLEFYRPFISLPRVRDLEWNPQTQRAKWSYRTKIDLVSLLVQLTGKPAPQCCTKCDPEIGLYIGCIVTASESHSATYYGCANCLYHGTQTYCSLKNWSQKKTGKEARCWPCSKAHATCTLERPSCGRCAIYGHQCFYPGEETEPARAHKPFLPSKTGVGPVAKPTSSLYATYRSDEKRSRDSSSARTPYIPIAPQTKQSSHENRVPYVSVAATKDEASKLSEIPSMERWERAPGRVRSQSRGAPQNIAFSKSYLTSGVDVAVCRDATFKIELIRSGDTHSFKAENGITRICSIASAAGKLTVRMDGEAPIVIGPHGLFIVRPRSACVVESEVYGEVALHITSVSN